MTNGKYNNKNQEFEFTTLFWNTIKNNIHHLTTPIIPNTTKTELKNLKYLKSNMNLIIKPIDKGLGTAIFNKREYITLATTQHLNDHSTYTHLSKNPLIQTVNTIKAIIKNEITSNNLPQSTANQLMPKSPYQLGKFYILPKLHKNKLQTRPIISNINHPTSNISEFLHKQMLKTTTTTQTYIKNSFELKEQLKNIKIDKNTIIITADIESLYTNIPQETGSQIVTDTMYDNNNEYKPTIKKPTFKTLLRNLLKHNIFEFNNKYYIQKNGTAMGTKMAPTYANIYLKHYEDIWLKMTTFKDNIILFKRYIDDILIIYNNQNNNIESFVEEIKTQIYGPQKLTVEYNNHKLNFLDINIHLNQYNNSITTSLYQKPFKNQQLLPQTSNHPIHIINNITKQALNRINKLCDKYSDKRLESNSLLATAHQAGYNFNDTKRQMNKIIKFNNNITKRSQNFINKNKNQQPGPIIKLNYSNDIIPLVRFIKQHWSNKTKFLKQPNPLIIYNTQKSIQQHLITAKVKINTKKELENIYHNSKNKYTTQLCNNTKCTICPFIDPTIKLKTTNHRIFPHNISKCFDNNIIYNIRCKKCKKEYIGESENNARVRLNRHINDIKNKANTSISQHFNQFDHNFKTDFKFNILLNSPIMDQNTRKAIESYFIRIKNTKQPLGMNIKS